MADDLLSDLDARFASATAQGPVRQVARKPAVSAAVDSPPLDVRTRRKAFRERLPWLMLFLGGRPVL